MENKKTALITGAGSPLGQAIAARLAQDGFALILCGEDEAALGNGAECRSCAVAQSSEAAVKELFARLELEYACIDVLINAQINNPVKSFAETQAEDIRAAFSAGLIPAMLFTQCAAEWMIKSGVKGRIVNISTDRAFQANGGSFVESVTSWALRGTTRAMAKHLAKKDIKVNACCIGEATPEEAAEMAAFLAGDGNVNITGQNMMVNHGRVMD